MTIQAVQTASHWGVYNVTDEHGSIIDTVPFAADLHPASFVGGLPEIVRGHLRIDQPYVQSGYLRKRSGQGRGADAFVPVSWEEALSG